MYAYTINVAHKGHHLFRTERDDFRQRVQDTFAELKRRFPAAEGYKVTISRHSTTQIEVTAEFISAKNEYETFQLRSPQ